MNKLYLSEKKYLETRKSELTNDSLGSQIIEVAGILNSKTSALLTHVSIMIAVSTGMLAYLSSIQTPSNLVKTILLIEIIAYLIISLLCLKSISSSRSFVSSQNREEILDPRIYEIAIRRLFYSIALYATMILTAILILVLLAETFVLF